jgi:hypothetical protein
MKILVWLILLVILTTLNGNDSLSHLALAREMSVQLILCLILNRGRACFTEVMLKE